MILNQLVLATVKIVKAKGKKSISQPLVEKECTPLRPGYVADLRDAGLVAAGYPLADVIVDQVGFNPTTFGASCGVTYNNPTKVELFSFPDPNPIMMPLGKIVQW